MTSARRAGRALLALSPLLWLLVPPLRRAVEASMGLHMLLQWPLLLAAGWAAAAWWPARRAVLPPAADAHGLSSATLASGVMAFWMIPAAVDLALIEPGTAALKYTSWWVAGLLLAQGRPRLGAVPAIFFLGNAAWMLLTAGLLYREAETRWCVSYLVDEQRAAGSGLVVAGLALVALALRIGAAAPAATRPEAGASAGLRNIRKASDDHQPGKARAAEQCSHAFTTSRIGEAHGCCGTDRSSGVSRQPGAAGRLDGHAGPA